MHSAGYKSCTIHYNGDMDGEVIITDYDNKKRKLSREGKEYAEIQEARVKVSYLIKKFEFCCVHNITRMQISTGQKPFWVNSKDIGYFLSERLLHHVRELLEETDLFDYYKLKSAAEYLGVSKKVLEGNN